MGELIGFVGRENEAYEAARILVENAHIGHIASNQSSSKPSLVILPQMNGSGLIMFVECTNYRRKNNVCSQVS